MEPVQILGTALLAASIFPKCSTPSAFRIVCDVARGPTLDPDADDVLYSEGIGYQLIQDPGTAPTNTIHYCTTPVSLFHLAGFTITIQYHDATQAGLVSMPNDPASLSRLLRLPVPNNLGAAPDGNAACPGSIDYRNVAVPRLSPELIVALVRVMCTDPVTAQSTVDAEIRDDFIDRRAALTRNLWVTESLNSAIAIIQDVFNNNTSTISGRFKAGVLMLCGYVPSSFQVISTEKADPDDLTNQFNFPGYYPTTLTCPSTARSHIIRNVWKCHLDYTEP